MQIKMYVKPASASLFGTVSRDSWPQSNRALALKETFPCCIKLCISITYSDNADIIQYDNDTWICKCNTKPSHLVWSSEPKHNKQQKTIRTRHLLQIFIHKGKADLKKSCINAHRTKLVRAQFSLLWNVKPYTLHTGSRRLHTFKTEEQPKGLEA